MKTRQKQAVKLTPQHSQPPRAEVEHRAGVGRTAPGAAGVHAASAPNHMVVDFVLMAGEHEVVFPARDGFSEAYAVVAMQQCNLLPIHNHLAKTTQKLHPDIRRKKLPVAGTGIDIAENGIDRNFQRLENGRQFRQHTGAANIAAVEHRTNIDLCKQARRVSCGRKISMRVGQYPDFHSTVLPENPETEKQVPSI